MSKEIIFIWQLQGFFQISIYCRKKQKIQDLKQMTVFDRELCAQGLTNQTFLYACSFC